jgi:hypothetical protein
MGVIYVCMCEIFIFYFCGICVGGEFTEEDLMYLTVDLNYTQDHDGP